MAMTLDNLAEMVQTGFEEMNDKMDTGFGLVNGRLDRVEGRLDRVEGRLDRVEDRLDYLESTVVTKDYLDDKLADLHGKLVTLVRREDDKVNVLVDTLGGHGVLPAADAARVRKLGPFTAA